MCDVSYVLQLDRRLAVAVQVAAMSEGGFDAVIDTQDAFDEALAAVHRPAPAPVVNARVAQTKSLLTELGVT